MKRTAIALAAVLALTGAGFAAEKDARIVKKPVAETSETVKQPVDQTVTDSISTEQNRGSKLGIDTSPWVITIGQ